MRPDDKIQTQRNRVVSIASSAGDYLSASARTRRPAKTSYISQLDDIQNHILSRLSEGDFTRLQPSLEPVRYAKNRIIYEAGDPIQQAIFINSGMAALVAITEDGQTIQTGIVGNQGFIGVPLVLQAHKAPYRVVAETRIEGFRVNASALRELFNRSVKAQDVFLRYTNVLLVQLLQASVCRIQHPLDQRVSSYLLVAADCLAAETLAVTHERLAIALGKHRNRIGVVTRALQEQGLVENSRRNIKILDRNGLKASACECYRIVCEATI
jgi:CRP-like cAMP-binding protein